MLRRSQLVQTVQLVGEGLVCVLTGPGTFYMQTRNLRSFAESLNPFLPRADKSRGMGMLGQIMGG